VAAILAADAQETLGLERAPYLGGKQAARSAQVTLCYGIWYAFQSGARGVDPGKELGVA
jgi:hypothetical protein